jgi:hypothetical protein
MREPGTSTEDMKRKPTGVPTGDSRLTRFGRLNYAAGLALVVTALLAALSGYIATDPQSHSDHDSQLFAQIGITIMGGLGVALILVGVACSLHVRTREHIAGMRTDLGGAVETAMANRRRIEQGASEVRDLEVTVRQYLDAVTPLAALLAAATARLDEVEKAVAAVAEHLPEALNLANWRGFNAAVREGFTEQTGTDSHPRRRPPHIGLVPREGNPDKN